MTIFLDYYMPDAEKGVTNVGIRQESGVYRAYKASELSNIITELMGMEQIVVYKRPATHIFRGMREYRMYLEDSNIRQRWFDLHSEIRKITGKQVALSRIAKSVLDLGPQSKILRLKESFDPIDRTDIEPKMDDRLDILQQVFEYAILHSQLSFVKGDETTWLDIEINEGVR